ncbi:hypothetical protein, partial [Pseudomonas asplenii]|uniref:hypothetical protein n=1 Tax=Pseudomonas asplenii TaxID=53407 RepID=UPI0019D4076E
DWLSMSIPSRFLTPHNQVSSDFVHSLDSFVRLNPCIHLVSDDSSVVTGTAAPVGGGASIARM